jgi:hypothetical protein
MLSGGSAFQLQNLTIRTLHGIVEAYFSAHQLAFTDEPEQPKTTVPPPLITSADVAPGASKGDRRDLAFQNGLQELRKLRTQPVP